MKRMWRRSTGRVRPGLTLIELLVAIVFFGLMGALLLPRLTPARDQEVTSAPATDDSSGACLPADGGFGGGFCPAQRTDPYIGIGAVLNLEPSADGCVRIDRPFAGSPAAEAGIEPGDVIEQVDGRSIQDESVDQVARIIRNGPLGSSVELTVSRSGDDQPLKVTVTRRCIHPPAPFRLDPE